MKLIWLQKLFLQSSTFSAIQPWWIIESPVWNEVSDPDWVYDYSTPRLSWLCSERQTSYITYEQFCTYDKINQFKASATQCSAHAALTESNEATGFIGGTTLVKASNFDANTICTSSQRYIILWHYFQHSHNQWVYPVRTSQSSKDWRWRWLVMPLYLVWMNKKKN